MRMLAFSVMVLTGVQAQAESAAARYLADEQIALACTSGTGTIAPEGLIERDFNADGRTDLLLDHQAISCTNSDFGTRSGFCGAALCTYYIYLRGEDGLLHSLGERLAVIEGVSSDEPPIISGFNAQFDRWAIQWNGTEFVSVP